MSIPRVFHHVWTSGDAMPGRVLAMRQTWIDRHPDWEFRIWRPEDLTWLRNRSLFDRAETYAQKADIARYEVVHRFGGVYVDTDMECLRPLDGLLNGCDFFAGRQHDGVVNIAIFGAAASHPILGDVIRRVPASCFVHRSGPVPIQTGPNLLDRVIEDGAWEGREGVRVFPQECFYPYRPLERWRGGQDSSRAFAVHHWDYSWRGGRALHARLSELVPRRSEPLRPHLLALWREARRGAKEGGRKQVGDRAKALELSAKRFIMRTARRLLPPTPALHGIPWGPGEVLVSTTSGVRLLCPTDDISISAELAITGTYDATFVHFLQKHLRSDMTFVDVGANVGLFTLIAAARVGPGGRVFAFECNPELISLLRHNVQMNHLDDRVRLIAKAAHRDDEERLFQVPRDQKVLGSLTRFAGEEARVQGLQEFRVECERLDVSLADVPYVDLVKIDVEGGEAAVLDGASRLLDEGRIGAISLEYRENALREELRAEMEKMLTSLVEDRGATLHTPSDARGIPLGEVLMVFEYPQLLIRFPDASIQP